MKFNRDISVLLLQSVDNKDMQICDPLAGSGVRSIRFMLELNKKKIKSIDINDGSEEAVKLIKRNLKFNKLQGSKKIKLTKKDANELIIESHGYDYIDIDPFGTPNPFLDSAIKRVSRGGILAVTATDTSALSGTYPKACKRKYWATPLRNELKHEIGVRILIRKVQIIGAQYEKALIPIFSFAKDHYDRVFFRCQKGKKDVDEILKKHEFVLNAGPLWTGELWEEKLVKAMITNTDKEKYDYEVKKMLQTLKDEVKIKTVGFYDIHSVCEKLKTKSVPKTEVILETIKKSKFKAAQTIFSPWGIRSNIDQKKFEKIIKNSIQ